MFPLVNHDVNLVTLCNSVHKALFRISDIWYFQRLFRETLYIWSRVQLSAYIVLASTHCRSWEIGIAELSFYAFCVGSAKVDRVILVSLIPGLMLCCSLLFLELLLLDECVVIAFKQAVWLPSMVQKLTYIYVGTCCQLYSKCESSQSEHIPKTFKHIHLNIYINLVLISTFHYCNIPDGTYSKNILTCCTLSEVPIALYMLRSE